MKGISGGMLTFEKAKLIVLFSLKTCAKNMDKNV